jgi:hypothetical protein
MTWKLHGCGELEALFVMHTMRKQPDETVRIAYPEAAGDAVPVVHEPKGMPPVFGCPLGWASLARLSVLVPIWEALLLVRVPKVTLIVVLV